MATASSAKRRGSRTGRSQTCSLCWRSLRSRLNASATALCWCRVTRQAWQSKKLPTIVRWHLRGHCGLKLDRCQVAHSALLGEAGTAYETMALPFRDVEDAVGTFGLLGAFRFMLKRLANGASDAAATLSLGRLAALVAVFAEGATAVVTALDTGDLPRVTDALVGLRVLAADMAQRARAHRNAYGPPDDAMIDRVFDDLDTSLSVARGPRKTRQMRLGAKLIADYRVLLG